MTWLAILGIGKRIGSGLFSWLSSLSAWQLLCLGLAIFAVIQHFEIIRWRHDSAKWEKQFQAEHKGRLADRSNYVVAQAEAAAKNKAAVNKVEQQYQRNSEDERQAYLSDLAKLRAQRLHPRVAAPQGSTGPASPSAPDSAAPRIDDSGVCVPATSDVCEAGAEIELKLMHLQDWVAKQVAVDPNK